MITSIGFDSKPLACVLWMEEGEPRYKTVCYSNKDVQDAVSLAECKEHIHYRKSYLVIKENNEDVGLDHSLYQAVI